MELEPRAPVDQRVADDERAAALHVEDEVVRLEALESAAKGNGSVTSLPDADGVIRRVPLIFRLGDKLYPSLAGEALRVAQPDATSYVIKSSGSSLDASCKYLNPNS